MKVLVLSPYADLLENTITSGGDECISRAADMEVSDWPDSDWVISFGYRKIIPHYRIERFQNQIINIHLSILPWNKGADPNFWSWFDNTPKGVTIHRITDAIDGGAILAQVAVTGFDFRDDTTLHSSYNDLLVAASGLFHRSWYGIKHDEIKPRELPMMAKGSYHRSKDKEIFMRYLKMGWDTPVGEIIDLGKLYRGTDDYD